MCWRNWAVACKHWTCFLRHLFHSRWVLSVFGFSLFLWKKKHQRRPNPRSIYRFAISNCLHAPFAQFRTISELSSPLLFSFFFQLFSFCSFFVFFISVTVVCVRICFVSFLFIYFFLSLFLFLLFLAVA